MRFLQIVEAKTEYEQLTNHLDELEDRVVDGLPTNVTLGNKGEFVQMYAHHHLVIQRKPYLDELMVGLNHYGVSTTQIWNTTCNSMLMS